MLKLLFFRIKEYLLKIINILFYKRKYTIQLFGKLPIYKDYISFIKNQEAIEWREWLIDTFTKDICLPDARWAFIYRSKSNSKILLGFISPSSDGSRLFPFSIFIAFKKDSIVYRNMNIPVFEIWERINSIWDELTCQEDVESLLELHKTKNFTIDTFKLNSTTIYERDLLIEKFIKDKTKNWPKILFFSDIKSKRYIIYDSEPDFFKQLAENC